MKKHSSLWYLARRLYSNATYDNAKPTRAVWKSVVGLEIHAQLATSTKLFSPSSIDFAAPVNSSVSLFDAAIPGTLPVLNKKCVELAVKTSLALSCQINPVSLFDRKHYFYSDLPAGYQITQQRKPLAKDGVVDFYVYTPGLHKAPYLKSSRIKQIQLEQDSGKSLHFDVERQSLVDLNRAGIGLIELVFEPDLSDGEEAAALVKELSLILQAVGACSCKMEEGALRVDANVSVHREGDPVGVRTEIKNIGSVRGVANAVSYEIKRHIGVLDIGGLVANETRAWDAIGKETVAMRDKETRQDYRYMPEPNLPPLRLRVSDLDRSPLDEHALDVRGWEQDVPELPQASRRNLMAHHGLTELQAVTLVGQPPILGFFKTLLAEGPSRDPKRVYNILMIELIGALNRHKLDADKCPLNSTCLGEIVDLVQSETIRKETCARVLDSQLQGCELTPVQFVQHHGLGQINDHAEIEKMCRQALERRPKDAAAYRAGKTKVFRVLLNDVSVMSNGLVNMKVASEVMKQVFDSGK